MVLRGGVAARSFRTGRVRPTGGAEQKRRDRLQLGHLQPRPLINAPGGVFGTARTTLADTARMGQAAKPAAGVDASQSGGIAGRAGRGWVLSHRTSFSSSGNDLSSSTHRDVQAALRARRGPLADGVSRWRRREPLVFAPAGRTDGAVHRRPSRTRRPERTAVHDGRENKHITSRHIYIGMYPTATAGGCGTCSLSSDRKNLCIYCTLQVSHILATDSHRPGLPAATRASRPVASWMRQGEVTFRLLCWVSRWSGALAGKPE